MIKAIDPGEGQELVIEGEVTTDDIYPGFCCPGHPYEICIVFPDANPRYTGVWGVCRNPDCPNTNGEPNDHWRGVSDFTLEDFAERLVKNANL
jgi:hypothetical protein